MTKFDSYSAIAKAEAAIVERTGLLGAASASAGPQLVARFFIQGFGNAGQRAAWARQPASVAISEPRVGAHPKHLTTRADTDADGYRITGEKAWVTNGPDAAVFVVLAITSIEEERKRYSTFLVPHDTSGLTIKELPEYQALPPSRHCGLLLNDCRVPRTALLGPAGTGYEAMALPFRDVEDAVGTFGLLGAFRFLLTHLAAGDMRQDAAPSLGALAALTTVFATTAQIVVAALDANQLPQQAAALAGLRVLAADMLQRARDHRDKSGPADTAIDRALADIETSLSVARGPRQARLARLGSELISR